MGNAPSAKLVFLGVLFNTGTYVKLNNCDGFEIGMPACMI